jgi:hypothetical protein
VIEAGHGAANELLVEHLVVGGREREIENVYMCERERENARERERESVKMRVMWE